MNTSWRAGVPPPWQPRAHPAAGASAPGECLLVPTNDRHQTKTPHRRLALQVPPLIEFTLRASSPPPRRASAILRRGALPQKSSTGPARRVHQGPEAATTQTDYTPHRLPSSIRGANDPAPSAQLGIAATSTVGPCRGWCSEHSDRCPLIFGTTRSFAPLCIGVAYQGRLTNSIAPETLQFAAQAAPRLWVVDTRTRGPHALDCLTHDVQYSIIDDHRNSRPER